jgi:hypothetical protein
MGVLQMKLVVVKLPVRARLETWKHNLWKPVSSRSCVPVQVSNCANG